MNINAEAEDRRWNLLYHGLLSNSLCMWLSLCNYVVYIKVSSVLHAFLWEYIHPPAHTDSTVGCHMSNATVGCHMSNGFSHTKFFCKAWGLNKLNFVTLGINITRIVNISATTKNKKQKIPPQTLEVKKKKRKQTAIKQTKPENLSIVHLCTKL